MKLFYEQYKNLKILFRSLSSVSLLVIGPLVLILLIGFAFSGEDIHGVRIGIISDNYESLEPAFQNFSSFATTYRYFGLSDCLSDIHTQRLHICLEFSGSIYNDSDLPSGTITFYYDNTKKTLSNKIVEVISDYFGVTAQKISIESATTIFTNIQNLVVYIDSKNEDILVLINESQNIKKDLSERRDKLVVIRKEFLPVYAEIKEIQSSLDNVSTRLNASYSDVNSSNITTDLKNLRSELEDYRLDNLRLYAYWINDTLVIANEFNQEGYDLTFLNYTIVNKSIVFDVANITFFNQSQVYYQMNSLEYALLSSLNSIDKFLVSLDNFSDSSASFYLAITEQKTQFDVAVSNIDEVKYSLDEDINATEEYIRKIDLAVVKVNEIQDELNVSIQGLTKLDPILAERLIKPIIQNHEPILPNIPNIQLAFPGMLAMIIIFISGLFANILAVSELNSKSFYRNSIAPVSKSVYVFGLIITSIIVISFQIMILLLVGQLRFGMHVSSVLQPLSLVILLLVLFFVFLGMIIAFLFKNAQTSILTTTFAVLAFFVFSDAIAPLETMPKLASIIAAKNPFVLANFAFKKILVFGLPIELVYNELTLLSLYIAVSLILLALVAKRRFT